MELIICEKPILYSDAIKEMQSIVEKISLGVSKDMLWTLEHHPIYTAGYTTYSSWINKYGSEIDGIPLVETGRGGQITYHGPGQRVIYFMINLKKRYGQIDLRKFLNDIHQLIIDVLAEFGVIGIKDPQYPGVWVRDGTKLNKIAAIGIRVSKGVSYHGIAVNINPDLRFFNLIEPCGISDNDRGVTSLTAILGRKVALSEFDHHLLSHIDKMFKR